jgi:hypothetical protein
MGVGFPGLTGRQLEISPASANDPATVAQLDQLESAAANGKIVAVARTPGFQELRYDPASDTWANQWAYGPPLQPQLRLGGAQLRQIARDENVVWTITAELPSGISGGGADRQPLLDIDPDVKAQENLDADADGIPDGGGVEPGIPRPAAGAPADFVVGVTYLGDAAKARLLIDGAVCTPPAGSCSLTATTAPTSGAPALRVQIPQGVSAGMHVIQIQNADGWVSNELPVFGETPATP